MSFTSEFYKMLKEVKDLELAAADLALYGVKMISTPDPYHWFVRMRGPKGSAYEKGRFYFSISAPTTYP